MTTEELITIEDALKNAVKMQDEGKLQESYDIYQAILAQQPHHLKAKYMLALLAMQIANNAAAKGLFKQILEVDPSYDEVFYPLGVIMREDGEYAEAIPYLQKMLELYPYHIKARHEIAICLQELEKSSESIAHYKKVLELNAEHLETVGHLVRIYLHLCLWKELEKIAPTMDRLNKQAIEKGLLPGENLSSNITRTDNPYVNFKLARAASKAIKNKINPEIKFSFASRDAHKKKLTIAYLCNNFNNHPTGHLICRLFEVHNRDRFNIIAYSHGKVDDEYYPIIKNGCDKFIDITTLNDWQAALKIYDDEVDILIDLKGHTSNARLGIFAYRPAPLQLTYLGFPGTSGADFFDYVITDRIVTPPEHARFYSEKFFYMPDCYQVNDYKQPISDKNYTRAEFGLPEVGFIFASFNQSYKIDPIMFDLWARLLHKVPGSVLWLLKNNTHAADILKAEIKNRGIDPERLIFADYIQVKSEHLARIKFADLALDTRICGGHTTSSDTLWAGVPVVTMLGKHFASRVCSSLLTAIGLPELITHSLAEYEELCLDLALNPEKLATLKQKLNANQSTMPLFDTRAFALNLEQGFWQIWHNYNKKAQ
jgi:protein O-GlcNAc transferase